MKIFRKCWKSGVSLLICVSLLSVSALAADLPSEEEQVVEQEQQGTDEDVLAEPAREAKDAEENVPATNEETKKESETEVNAEEVNEIKPRNLDVPTLIESAKTGEKEYVPLGEDQDQKTDAFDGKKTGVAPGTVVKSADCGFSKGTLFYEVTALGNGTYKLRIYGTGKMLTIGATYGAPWHGYADGIVSIDLEEGLESIAQFAFTDCDQVTSITIPASVTTMYSKSLQMRGLKSVYFLGSYSEKMKADAFDRTGDLKIYYDQSDESWAGKSFSNATMQADAISLENVGAVEASCTTDGNIQYYYNKTWDKFFSDAAGKLEITDKDSVVIRAFGHDWDEGVVTKGPTYTEEGVKTYTCSRCEETWEEGIPILEAGGVPGDVTEDENTQDEENPDLDDDAGEIIAGGETTGATGITGITGITETTGTAGKNQPESIQNDQTQAVKTTAGQVKTADETSYVLYLVLLLLSGFMIAWAIRRRFFR